MKKGFTLVEIIICIALISLIGIGTTIVIIKNNNQKELDILEKNKTNFDNALEVYLSNHNEIINNINNNVEGAIVSLELLKNEGLINDNLKIDYENNYYVVTNAFLGNKNLEENVVEEECENSIGLEKVASWAENNNTDNVLYFCPKEGTPKNNINDPNESCVDGDNRLYCQIIKNAKETVSSGNNDLTILGDDTRTHETYTELRPQEYKININNSDFNSWIVFLYDSYNPSTSYTWYRSDEYEYYRNNILAEIKTKISENSEIFFGPYEKCYTDYNSSSSRALCIDKNETVNKITNVSETCTSSDCEFTYKIIDTHPSTVRTLITDEDNYGISYYYKGDVIDNYVNFAGMCWRIVRVQGDGSVKLILSSKNNECQNDDKDSILGYGSYGGHTYSFGDNNPIVADFEKGTFNGNFNDPRILNQNGLVLREELDKFYTNKLSTYENKLKKERTCLEYNIDNDDGTISIDNTKLYCNTYGDKVTNSRYVSTLMYSELINSRDKGVSYLNYMLSAWKNTYTQYQHYCYDYAKIADFWTITPVNENNSLYVYTSSGNIPAVRNELRTNGCRALSGIRPVIILKSDVISSGDGTQTNPYVIN